MFGVKIRLVIEEPCYVGIWLVKPVRDVLRFVPVVKKLRGVCRDVMRVCDALSLFLENVEHGARRRFP
jgi:hypothetical protein